MSYKIIHSISSYNVFGPEKTVINESLALREKGYRVIIVLIRPEGTSPFLEKVKETGLEYYHLVSNAKFDFAGIFKLASFLKKTKCDLVHSHGYKSDVISLWASWLVGVPAITTIHGWTSENSKVRFYEKLQALSWTGFKIIVCVSDFYRQKAIQLGVCRKKLILIYNGIISKNVSNGEEKNKDLTVAIIGRLSIEKGHQYFLEAAKKVLGQEKNIKFLIVGDGPEEEKIKEIIKQLELSENVRLLGYVKDMASVYKQIDVVVMPSLREGLPNVLLEAMLHEKFVIASRVGGIPEVIRDEKDGILVEPKDYQTIANIIIRAMDNPFWRNEIIANAKKRVLSDFSFERRMEQIEKCYKDIIG